MSDRNAGVIQDFRANGGRVKGFENQPVLLLHHTGAKSGKERINPLAYLKVDGGYAVFASKAGSDSNPDWYHNLKANPDAVVEVGTDTFRVTARIAEGEEHDEIWSTQKNFNSNFARYEERTSRDRIPVIILETA